MKILIQHPHETNPSDWEEIDSSDWATLPKRKTLPTDVKDIGTGLDFVNTETTSSCTMLCIKSDANDAGDTVDAQAGVNDNGSTATKDELIIRA